MTMINLGLRFALELTLLGTLGYWGFQSNGGVLRWLLGIGAPLVAAIAWGVWVAPASSNRLADPLRLVVEITLFGAGVLALWMAEQRGAAIAFGVVVLMNLVLLTFWQQR